MVPSVPAPALLPVAIGREEAREAARHELARPAYHQDDPSLFMRLFIEAVDWVERLLSRAADAAPGGWPGLVAITVLIVVLLVAVRLRAGPIARNRARAEPLLSGPALTADQHRQNAERFAATEQWDEALRERLRAIARAMEERAILEPRAGRTADELAAECAATLPGYADELYAVTRLFDDVWYGQRPTAAGDYDRVRDLDEGLRRARPALAASR